MEKLVLNKPQDRTWNALMDAVKSKDLAGARLALADGANPRRPDSSEQTPLHWAASLGDAEMSKLLLPLSDPSARDGRRMTALMCAASLGRHGTLELLLDEANGREVMQGGFTALMLAAQKGHAQCARLIGEKFPVQWLERAFSGKGALYASAFGGSVELVKLSLEHAAPTLDDVEEALSFSCMGKRTAFMPLLLSVWDERSNGRLISLAELSRAAASMEDPRWAAELGSRADWRLGEENPLHLASIKHAGVVAELAKAAPRSMRLAKSRLGHSALCACSAMGRDEKGQALMWSAQEISSDPMASDDMREAMKIAARASKPRLLDELLKRAEPVWGEADMTALSSELLGEAAAAGSLLCIEKLLMRGAKPTVAGDGTTLLMAAAQNGALGCVKLLVEHCDVLARDANGRLASQRGGHQSGAGEVVKFLKRQEAMARERADIADASLSGSNKARISL